MQIRAVARQDRDEWVRMRQCLFSNPSPVEVDEWFDARRGTHAVGVAVFVADRGDGTLAGFIEVGSRDYAEGCETTPVAYLEGWYVDPDSRRQGIGLRLVQAAEAWASGNGYSEMASDTELGNDVSVCVHEALGYEEIERQICFRKRLLPASDEGG